jgi:uncharacterized protein YcfJ
MIHMTGNITKLSLLTLFACLALACTEDRPMTRGEQGALIGGATGAGAGAIIGNQRGVGIEGAAVGAVAGAATGAMVGESQETYESTVELQHEILKRQGEELERQDREVEDLKRQQYHNEQMRVYE